MANKKTSELTAADHVDGVDQVAILQEGVDLRAPINLVRGYQLYAARLNYVSSFSNIIHVNEIGEIVWTKPGTGYYVGTLVGGFPDGRTSVKTGNSDRNINDSGNVIVESVVASEDTIEIYTFDSTYTPADRNLSHVEVEIRIYP